jgi:hypothetical protein
MIIVVKSVGVSVSALFVRNNTRCLRLHECPPDKSNNFLTADKFGMKKRFKSGDGRCLGPRLVYKKSIPFSRGTL